MTATKDTGQSMRAIFLALFAAAGLMACTSGDRPLHDMSGAGNGPDDFSVLPVAPLEIPETMQLVNPTPGGTNRVDPNPKAEAIAALGGRASAQVAGGIPARDAALVARASRYGTDANIRQTLATEDEAYRRSARRFSLFGGASYFSAYARQALDAYAELARFRAAGVATPSAPPAQ